MSKSHYKILFQKSAYREYQILPKAVKSRFGRALEMLSVDPLSAALIFKKARGKENHYSIRAGDYRIIYSLQTGALIVRVIRADHSKDVYRYF